MVKLTKIYTRGGDRGKTSLGDGRRVSKHDLRVAAYGTVDEANAAIGMSRLHTEGEADAMLARIQDDLFDLGADLCTPGEEFDDPVRLRMTATQVDRLEAEIDALNTKLAPLTSFILPGGEAAAANGQAPMDISGPGDGASSSAASSGGGGQKLGGGGQPADAITRLGLAAQAPKAGEDYWASLGGGNKMR